MRFALLFILLIFSLAASAQEKIVIKKDLQADWLISDSSTYRKFESSDDAKTIYFTLNAQIFKTDYLQLRSSQPVSILVNTILLTDKADQLTLSIDSLIKLYHSPELFVSIHGEEPVTSDNLHTQIVARVLHEAGKPDESYLKAKVNFRDYAVTAILALIIFLVSIIRLNPGLSSDYFSIRKIFSLRESEDDHYYYRVTSATILFYVFTSLMLGLYILVVARFTNVRLGLDNLLSASYWMLIFTWLKVSLYVLLFLFAKIVIIYIVSTLFGIREVAGYHFFNFVRLLLVTIGVFTLVWVIYFIPYGQRQGFYDFLYALIPWILGAWIVLGFFKLASRVRHSAFHLFSYICATELIPFFIIIEVLNK